MRAFPLRRSIAVAALGVSSFFVLSCGGDSGTPSPTPNSVVVTPGADTLISIGATRTFTASVLDANGDPIDGKTIAWSSTAPGVLSVDATTGVATAVGNGTAQVQATSGTLHGAANVAVIQLVASVTVTPGNVAFTAVGDTARFTAVAKDGGGTPVVGVQVLWSVSDNTVAVVDTLGLAKAKGPGTALVSAQAQTRAGYAAIGVAPTVTQIAILAKPDSGTAGEPIFTALQVELRDVNGHRVMDASVPVVVSAGGAATGTPLHGTTALISDQGRASFTGLSLDRAGADRLRVTVGALPVDSSATLTVSPGPLVKLHVDSVAPVVTAGDTFVVTVRAVDRFLNTVPTVGGHGSLAIRGPVNSAAGGTFGAGVAYFILQDLTTAGGPYHLTATVDALPLPGDTIALTVHHAAPTQLSLDPLGGLHTPRGHFGDTTRIHVADKFGNPVADSSFTIQLGVSHWNFSSPGQYSEKIFGSTSVPYLNGEAAVALGVTRPGRVDLTFSTGGVTPDTIFNAATTLPAAIEGQMLATDLTSCIWATFCSGSDQYGLLGVDSTLVPMDSLFIPRDGIGTPGFADGGARHACSADDYGNGGFQIGCWGDNSDGQLGGGTVGGASAALVLSPIYSSIDLLSAGGAHTCAQVDGSLKCWGRNDQGQLGTGSAGGSTGTPTLVTGGHTWASVSAGGRHTCGLDDIGRIWCWGADDFGQLGDSGISGASSAVPVEVAGGHTWAGVAAGGDFTCGTRADTTGGPPIKVFCWGRNDKGQLGGATDSAFSAVPVSITGGTSMDLAPVLGAAFGCILMGQDGSPTFGQLAVYCWGANDHGQLGRGSFTPSDTVGLVQGVFGQSFDLHGGMVAGAEFICGSEGGVQGLWVCWGRNDHGQFGVGFTNDSPVGVIVQQVY